MRLVTPQNSTIIFGFDSAWTDSPKAPGAICAIAFDDSGQVEFHEPRLVSFAAALTFIEALRKDFAVSLVALDQPTIVPNGSGSRPIDKVAASLVSFVGGGVQPAYRSKIGIFCENAPVWSFLSRLNASEAPVEARTARAGNFSLKCFQHSPFPRLRMNSPRGFAPPNTIRRIEENFGLRTGIPLPARSARPPGRLA